MKGKTVAQIIEHLQGYAPDDEVIVYIGEDAALAVVVGLDSAGCEGGPALSVEELGGGNSGG